MVGMQSNPCVFEPATDGAPGARMVRPQRRWTGKIQVHLGIRAVCGNVCGRTDRRRPAADDDHRARLADLPMMVGQFRGHLLLVAETGGSPEPVGDTGRDDQGVIRLVEGRAVGPGDGESLRVRVQ